MALIRDSVEYFALTHDEFEKFRSEGNTVAGRRLAWTRISDAKKNQKGDYGELLLFLLLSFKLPNRIPRFVTKVRLRSSCGEQIKGFDCAHVTLEDGQICLWLGESKFHSNLSNAISSAIGSLEKHWEEGYLSKELKILGGNCEANYGIDDRIQNELKAVLNGGRSLDRIHFKIPVLLTYDSQCIQDNIAIDQKFKDQLSLELERHFSSIETRFPKEIPPNFYLMFFLMPLRLVKDIQDSLEKIEEVMK